MHSANRPATVLSPEKQLSRKLFFQRKSRNIEDAAFKGCGKSENMPVERRLLQLVTAALADSITAIFVPLVAATPTVTRSIGTPLP